MSVFMRDVWVYYIGVISGVMGIIGFNMIIFYSISSKAVKVCTASSTKQKISYIQDNAMGYELLSCS